MPSKYTGNITRNTDWGGDASTGFLPVAGSSVQSFLKGEINSKIGAVYKPDGANFVYYFANEDDKRAFIETGDESYVLDSFEMASKYDVQIDSSTLILSHSVIDGTTGNTAEFAFKIVDDNDMTADARARIEFGFTGSGISNKFTNEIPVVAGDWTRVSVNIDNYLRSGSNSVAVKITGLSTQANTQFVMTYNLFDLSFAPSFEYNVVQTGNTISVPYIIECREPKHLEFYIDGVAVTSSEPMVINEIRMDSRATLNIAGLEAGQHSLQVRAYVRATDGTLFYTPTHYYTFAKEGVAEPSFLMYIVMDNTSGVFVDGEGLKISVSQFEQVSFDWAIYDYMRRKLNVKFEYNGTNIASSVVDENGRINTFTYRPMNFGEDNILRIYALGEDDETIFEHTVTIDVAETSSGIKEATDGLLLKLQATGRRNSDEDKDVWECVGTDGNIYRANFSGFSWNAQQGWNEETESLVISNGAVVNFNIQPMKNNWVLQGGAIEVDLETFDIENEDAVICECSNNLGTDEAYFRITATKAELSTANHVSINTRYKDNERLKIAFIGNRAGPHDDGYLIYIVINGVLERAALYKDGDSMYSFANLSIGDPTGQCKVRLRSIRVYDRAISVDQAFNNYVVDSDNVQELYEKNNVLKEGSSSEVGFDEVANKLPVMIFTGDMDDIVNNGQDKEWRRFDVEYINRQEPERNFVAFNCQMKLQGTSSLGYPRKNFKLKTKDKYFTEDVYNASRFELDPNSVVGNRMLRIKATGEQIDFDDFKTGGRLNNQYIFMLDYEGKPLKKGKYRFRKDAHKATKWTLKADFMESSCSHNVAAGRSWNDIFENTPLLSNGDASYTNNTYRDSALVSKAAYIEYTREDGVHCKIENNTDGINRQKDYVCRTDAQKRCISAGQDDIRTAVDGFPMVCFYRRTHAENNLIFIGQYNFINDKGSYEVFGFEDIESPEDEETMIYDASKVECWEGLKNTNPLSLFKTDEGFYDWNTDGTLRKWAETYEARYPDPEDVESDPSSLYELTKWLVSTRHVSGETQYSGTLDIDASFARRINGYQYGYTDDTADSYAYAEGTGLEDNAENRQKKFETEKWEHFDVWKVAGYYVYLRRYGAVDQFVKNTMLFTDGNGRYDPRTDKKYRKWFFINYDNDCLFGLRNNGQLAFHWDLDRQTIDAASDVIIDDQADDEGGAVNAYAMMGHDSTLWNNLEADDEFMRMVRDLDYSMTKYKLNYDNMVTEFDTKQTEMWCERIYNANERYKYINAAKGIGDMAGKPVNNLWMLQGTRRSHRHWWIANHFNLLDAQWLSGDYKNTYVEIKTNCRAGTAARCIAGSKYFYAWGQQKKIYESNMVRNEGDEIVFAFPTDQSQGDPVYIYAFNKMTEMDFSEMASLAYEGSFKFVLGNDLVQNTMKKLVIGNPNVKNLMSQDTTTWSVLPNLEYIDITNYEGITSLPFKSFNNLHTFKAAGSKLGSFEPSEGSVFDRVELPASVKTLSLIDVSFRNNVFDDLIYTPNTNLDNLTIANNDGVGLDYYNKLIRPWIDAIDASAQSALLYLGKSLVLRNVKWSFNNLNNIKVFRHFVSAQTFQMSGVIDLRSCGNLSMENIDEIKSIFGENCFNPKLSPLYIITPDSVFINSEKTEMVAGETNVFSRVIYPDERAIIENLNEIKYYIVEDTTSAKTDAPDRIIFEDPIAGKNYLVVESTELVRHGLTLTNTYDADHKQIGVLSCTEDVVGSDTTFKVLVYMGLMGSVFDKVSLMNFTVKDPTYASRATISGNKSLYNNIEYKFVLDPRTNRDLAPIGTYNVTWSLSGEAASSYVESYRVNPDNQLEFFVTMNQYQPEISSKMTVIAEISNHNGTNVEARYDVLALNETVIMTSDSNPTAMRICYEAGWAVNADAMKKSQAEAVTNLGTRFQNVSETFSFPELVYFTGLENLPENAFAASKIEEIVIPENINYIGAYCFDGCSSLKNVYVQRTEGSSIYYERTLPSAITEITEGCFRNCSSLNELDIPEGVTTIRNYAFGNSGFRKVMLPSAELAEGVLRLPSTLTTIEGNAFETQRWNALTTTNKLTHFEIPTALTISDFAVLRGKEYDSFVVEEGHVKYMLSEDGVLMASDGNTVLRYPPKAAYREAYYLPSAQVIYPYAFFAVQNLDSIVSLTNSTIQTIMEGFCMASNVVTVDLSTCANLSTGEIPENAFRDCVKLTNVYLPRGSVLKKIGMRAFDGCSVLEEIEIPASVEEFAMDARGYSYTFVNCPRLRTLVLPDSIKKMGIESVSNCGNLVDIVFPAYFDYTKAKRVGVEILADCEGWSVVRNCPNLTGITLPAFSVTVDDGEGNMVSEIVNRNAFGADGYVSRYLNGEDIDASYGRTEGFPLIINGLLNIKEFRLPSVDDGESYISENGAIMSADKRELCVIPKNLTSFTIPSTVQIIDGYAFEGSQVTSVTLPEGILSAGKCAFRNCRRFTELTLPASMQSLGEAALMGTVIEEMTINGGTSLGFQMYDGCSALRKLTFNNLPETGYIINQFAFRGCTNLKTIIVASDNIPILAGIDDEYQYSWHPLYPAGRNVPQSERKLYVSIGTSSLYQADERGWAWTINPAYAAFNIEEAIPLDGFAHVKIYNNGTPFTSTVYATSSLGHLVGDGGAPYSCSYFDGKHLFELDGLYDNETVTVYSDSELTNVIGTFNPRAYSSEYQVGELVNAAPRRTKLFSSGIFGATAPVEDENEEVVEITKGEYESLVSKVNQMMRIVNKLVK